MLCETTQTTTLAGSTVHVTYKYKQTGVFVLSLRITEYYTGIKTNNKTKYDKEHAASSVEPFVEAGLPVWRSRLHNTPA